VWHQSQYLLEEYALVITLKYRCGPNLSHFIDVLIEKSLSHRRV
jgi:hypothetical protein